MTSPEDRPVLYLDIDGVLNPWRAKNPRKHWPDYRKHTVNLPDGRSYRMWFAPSLGNAVAALAARRNTEIVWATSWADHLNLVTDLSGLPDGLRSLPYDPEADSDLRNCGKLPFVAADAGSRPVVWVDDALGTGDKQWARERPHPTMLVAPSPSAGLRQADLDRVDAWLASVAPPPTATR